MLNQSHPEFGDTSATAVAFTGVFTNNTPDGGAKVSVITETEGDGNKTAVPSAALTPGQNERNGAGDALMGENLYECHHLTGGAKHPGRIVETPGLANIKPPRPTYRPRLPKKAHRSSHAYFFTVKVGANSMKNFHDDFCAKPAEFAH